ncbi:MAG: phosphoribosylformylglycinamidine synthase I [Candidatus Micrarchaeia archaeon]
MKIPKAAILTGFGINSEVETAHALNVAGAQCEFVHFNSLADNPKKLEEFQIFVLSGGWSFADDIQSGRVLANKLRFKLDAPMRSFIDAQKPVLGICNGFQALVQLGALPGWDNCKLGNVTLMHNKSGKFEDRWVRLRTETSVCPYAQGMSSVFSLPIRHGEGQFVMATQKVLDKLNENRQVVFRYADKDGMKTSKYPDNPNGSGDAIAGICNESGNVIGLMPHPECHVRYLQNPHWTSNPPHKLPNDPISSVLRKFGIGKKSIDDYGNCMPFFENIVKQAKKIM